MPKPKSTAAKKAMAERGTFKVGTNTDYGKPYSRAVSAAVAPFNAQLKRAQAVWGQRLLECVTPSTAALYGKLVADLDEAMIADDAQAVAGLSERLCNGLALMHRQAISSGHKPASRDLALAVVDGKTYAFVLHGDLGAIRREHPDWIVWHIEDAVHAMRGRFEELIPAAAKHFPNARVVDVRREIVDDEIDF